MTNKLRYKVTALLLRADDAIRFSDWTHAYSPKQARLQFYKKHSDLQLFYATAIQL